MKTLLPQNIDRTFFKGNALVIDLPDAVGMNRTVGAKAYYGNKVELLPSINQPTVTRYRQEEVTGTRITLTAQQTSRIDSMYLAITYGGNVKAWGQFRFEKASSPVGKSAGETIPLTLGNPDITIPITIADATIETAPPIPGPIQVGTFAEAQALAVGTEYKRILVEVDEDDEYRENNVYEYWPGKGLEITL